MHRIRILFAATIFCSAMLLAHLPAVAAQQAATPPADKPVSVADRTTKIAVVHEGTDAVGTRLAFQLKNVYNTSSLFTLTDKDESKLKIFVTTEAEFPSRPGIASAYSVVWAFSQSEGTLAFLLARELGLATVEEIDALALKIAERTDGIAARYAYLFSKK